MLLPHYVSVCVSRFLLETFDLIGKLAYAFIQALEERLLTYIYS